MAKYFRTGNAIFEDSIAVLIRFPLSQEGWVYSTFLGAMVYLADVESWVTGGETTPQEASDLFNSIYDGIRPMLFLIGMVSDFAAALPDDSGWLQCDGSYYDQEAYTELYGIIGTDYNTGGEPSGSFRVPDLRGRVRATVNSGLARLPAFADTLGGTGGESSHTLDTSELPSHGHSDTGHIHTTHGHLGGLALAPGELPVTVPSPFPDVTGSASANITDTGGGGSHNNVQPTMALYTYILAKL